MAIAILLFLMGAGVVLNGIAVKRQWLGVAVVSGIFSLVMLLVLIVLLP